MDADHIFLAAIKDMAEIFSQLGQEIFHQGIAGSDRQAFQFLQVAALRAQAALCDGFGSANQVFTMAVLRCAHMVVQAGSILHLQKAATRVQNQRMESLKVLLARQKKWRKTRQNQKMGKKKKKFPPMMSMEKTA